TSGNASGSASVTVPSLVSIYVTATSTTVLLGAHWQYVATGQYDDGSTKDLTSAVAWSSSDTAVAAVSNSQGSKGRVTGVAEGTATITATLATSSGSAPVTVSSSGVFGTVVFSDGAPVPYPNIFVNRTDSQGNVQTYYGPSDEKGNYQVSGVGSGAFTVLAQDGQTGLSGSASGQLSNPTEPANVPVQLEPSGTVSGTIRDASGAPVYNASISLFSSGVQLFSFQFYRFVSSDDEGQYEVDRIALGEVAVTATAPPPVDWVPGYVGAATGNLDSGGQTISVDVDLPPTSTIMGTVYA